MADVPSSQGSETHGLDSPSGISPLRLGGTPSAPSADTPCTLVLHISDDAFAQPIVTECHRVPTTTGHRDQPSLCLRAEGDRPWAYPRSLSVLRMLLWRNQQEAPVRAEKIAPQYGAAREGLSARRRGSRPSGLSGTVVQWEGRGADPPQSQGQSRAGRPQRPGSAGGLVVAHRDVHAGSARGGPTQVPFPPRTRGS